MTDTSDIFSRIMHVHTITEIISARTNNVYQALSLHAPPLQFEQESLGTRLVCGVGKAALKSYMYVSHYGCSAKMLLLYTFSLKLNSYRLASSCLTAPTCILSTDNTKIV